MEEKIENRQENLAKKERFSFELRVNEYIICQRFFKIEDFKYKSLSSIQLKETINECVELIKRDLKLKSNQYLIYTAPQIYDNVEDMNRRIAAGSLGLTPYTYIIFRESEDVYLWDGEKVEKYEGSFNRNDYLYNAHTQEEGDFVLKFSFLDFGNEIISQVFSGNDYPRFVRTNIDLSNSKNRYREGANFSPFEFAMVDIMNSGREDLIPIIINKIVETCSYEDPHDYYTNDTYGDKRYNFRILETLRRQSQ